MRATLGSIVAACAALLILVAAEPAVERYWADYGWVLVASERDTTAQCVNGYLCIGNQNAACNRDDMRALGVTHVVSLIGSLDCTPPDVPRTLIDVADRPGQDMTAAFEEGARAIDAARAAGGRVLVHCAAGVSRSSATVIYYLMTREHQSYDEALARVRDVRSIANPNEGFERQLRALEYNKSEL